MKILLFVFPIALTFSSSVGAEIFQINQREINITIPEGYCSINSNQYPDKNIFDQYKRGTKYPENSISLLLNCEVIEAYRKDMGSFWKKHFTSLPKVRQYFKINLLPNTRNKDLSGQEQLIKEVVCPKFETQKASIDYVNLENKENERNFLSALEVGNPSLIGVVKVDKNTCYLAHIEKFLNEENTVSFQLSIISPNIQNSFAVINMFSTPYTNYDSIEKAANTLQEFNRLQ
ncbi:hypothetical protein WH95_00105 [Kiloniella litopenaei]|uniref:Uncharacterized protein n=1 Tax=Kiloniella litopenaei TaxID=1549748 RepID=A0A0M2RG64_9PROT|nr:hypothetical protein [Kiloniella litopenaei]KKJ78553.1 hypothetical protein WH95_00105 [Kiloniella litopenaei]